MSDEIAGAAGRYRTGIIDVIDAARPTKSSTGFRIALARCESPIEQAYCLELFQVPGIQAVDGDFTGAVIAETSWYERLILVFAQQPIMQYRADFLLVGVSRLTAEPNFVIVECDGEAYHSAREQVRRDEFRQRTLQNTGFKVIRFTGSEIHQSPQRVIVRTIAAFANHGWNPSHCPKWVNDWEFSRVLSELRGMGEADRQAKRESRRSRPIEEEE